MVLGINLHFSNVSSVYAVENDDEVVVAQHCFDRPVMSMVVVVVAAVQQLLNVWNLEIMDDH